MECSTCKDQVITFPWLVVGWLVRWLGGSVWFVGWLVRWLGGWVVRCGSLVHSLALWFVRWFVGWLVCMLDDLYVGLYVWREERTDYLLCK